jgi:hypothetical protein
MRRCFLFSLFLTVFFLPCDAHEVELSQVKIKIEVESDQIQARLVSPAGYWIEDVLGQTVPPPPSNWPIESQDRVKAEINKNFILTQNGTVLVLRSLECRYIEEPYSASSAKVSFLATYKLEEASALAIQVHFPESQLRFSGQDAVETSLTAQQPDFSIDLNRVRKTASEYAKESFATMFSASLTSGTFFMLIFIGFVIQKKRASLQGAILWIGNLLFVAVGYSLFHVSVHASVATLSWIGLTLVIGLLVFDVGRSGLVLVPFVFGMSFVATLLLNEFVKTLPFLITRSSTIAPAAFLGMVGAGIAIWIACEAVYAVYARQVKSNYKDLADRMMLFHLRAASGFLLFVGSMRIIRSWIVR